VFAASSTYTNPLSAVEFVRDTGVDALAISYGTMHGASKGKNVKLRREIPIAIRECLAHEDLDCALVSHGSSTVPQYIVREINERRGPRHSRRRASGSHPRRYQQDQRRYGHPSRRDTQHARAL